MAPPPPYQRLLAAVALLCVSGLIVLLFGVGPGGHLRHPDAGPPSPPVVLGDSRPHDDTGDRPPRAATGRPECTDFYGATCDPDAPSMFAQLARANEATMRTLVRATGTYRACLAVRAAPLPAPGSDALGDWIAAGARLPLQVRVETALDRPQQALHLAWDDHLYRVLAARDDEDASRARILFPVEIFERRTDDEDASTWEEYAGRYEAWPHVRTRLPSAWVTALERAFPAALADRDGADVAVWTAPGVTDARLRAVADAWAAYPAARRAFWTAQQALLWDAAHDAAGYRQIEATWAPADLRAPAPVEPHPFGASPDPAAERLAADAAESADERACRALAEVVERAGLNQAFLAAVGLADGARTEEVQALVREVAHAVAGLLHAGAAHLDAVTRDAGIAKLEQAAVYVLGPSASAANGAARLDALPADDLASRLGAWRAAAHARAAAQLATPHAAWRRTLGQHLVHTVRYATVNAWYQPVRNAITVPPGILRAPVYVPGATHRSERLAHVGMILAHELGHALDVHGRLFDAEGVFVPPASRGWWTEADAAGLDARMACLAADYGHPCGRNDYGAHTIGEDTADQLGVRAAYALLVTAPDGDRTESERSRAFFEAYAQLWCARTPSHTAQCRQVALDVHALPQHRVNKSLRQLATFAAAYECGEGDEMVNSEPCLVY